MGDRFKDLQINPELYIQEHNLSIKKVKLCNIYIALYI